MSPFTVIPGRRDSRLLITCEHASCQLPPQYDNLGVAPEELEGHIAWDIGAAEVSRFLANALSSPAVLSGASRLMIDCNRHENDHDLIVEMSDGIAVPGNVGIDGAERSRRLESFYRPYHEAIDEMLAEHRCALLLSIHSFTPELRTAAGSGQRPFDVGVLFDDHERHAHALGRALTDTGLAVRYNEPYSGLQGLIFSARSHGLRHGRKYLELELNNVLLRTGADVQRVGALVAQGLNRLLEDECESY
jgi:predicted N-formylglutamate amidohydrolase